MATPRYGPYPNPRRCGILEPQHCCFGLFLDRDGSSCGIPNVSTNRNHPPMYHPCQTQSIWHRIGNSCPWPNASRNHPLLHGNPCRFRLVTKQRHCRLCSSRLLLWWCLLWLSRRNPSCSFSQTDFDNDGCDCIAIVVDAMTRKMDP